MLHIIFYLYFFFGISIVTSSEAEFSDSNCILYKSGLNDDCVEKITRFLVAGKFIDELVILF